MSCYRISFSQQHHHDDFALNMQVIAHIDVTLMHARLQMTCAGRTATSMVSWLTDVFGAFFASGALHDRWSPDESACRPDELLFTDVPISIEVEQ